MHSLVLERGIFGRALRLGVTQVATEPGADPDYVAVADGVTALVAVPFRLTAGPGLLGVELVGTPLPESLPGELEGAVDVLVESFGKLTPRGRKASALNELSRSFVRLASARDARSLLELTARLVGEALRLDWVLALAGTRARPRAAVGVAPHDPLAARAGAGPGRDPRRGPQLGARPRARRRRLGPDPARRPGDAATRRSSCCRCGRAARWPG